MKRHLNIKIHGQVQGVNFRTESKRQADKLNLTGLVRNEGDGSLYIEVEGEEESLNKFTAWCNKGTFWSKVDKVEVQESDIKDFEDYSVDY